MKITCLAIGKLREDHFRAAAAEYMKRLTRYLPFEVRELKEVRGKRDDAEIRRLESARLLDALPARAAIVVLDERGKQFDSAGFAAMLEQQMMGGQDLCFVIGGALGHDPSLRKRADKLLALSSMTLPHELARVLLIEQIYRGMTIVRGEKYHK